MAADKGNNYAGNARVARKALLDAMAVRDGTQDPKKGVQQYNTLVDMWDKQITKALEGDNDSFKHIVERLDGKATQPISGDEDNPLTVVQRIELIPLGSNR